MSEPNSLTIEEVIEIARTAIRENASLRQEIKELREASRMEFELIKHRIDALQKR